MTSKSLFLKGMKEDMRHKVWMLALSMLGSFLAMPVLCLLYYSDVEDRVSANLVSSKELLAATTESIGRMAEFFRQELMLSTGIIAIVGAIIVGLECFRYLQQKPMVDTYHSLPVSRMQMFGVKYVNGILIWLVPYLLGMLLTLLFSAVFLGRMGGLHGIPVLIKETGINTAVLIVVFLLVYHLMLLATMLTGNLLNTLAVAAIIGCGVISAYVTGLGFMMTYFHSYYLQGRGLMAAMYVSPMAAPVYLMGTRIQDEMQILPCLICLGVAFLLGALALFAYCRRPSERAGRGVDMKWAAGIMRLYVSVLGGMGGWLLMYSLVGSMAWGIFGALLMGILIYGVLDVVFTMDFKAFFRHRWSMAASMILTMLICFGFRGDWMGYDRYLPEQEQIRSISIACVTYGNGRYGEEIMNGMELTDTAQIYAFLERGVENIFGRFHRTEDTSAEKGYGGEDSYKRDAFKVKVTLANGWSYYRVYPYYKWDEEVVLPLLCSEEYVRNAYYLSEDLMEECYRMRFITGSNNDSRVMDVEIDDREIHQEIAEAYNQDLLERPRAMVLGEDRVLGRIIVWTRQEYARSMNLYILEGMTHTREAMERNGIRIFNQPTESANIESITFTVNITRDMGSAVSGQAERSIRNHFGVYPKGLPGTLNEDGQETYSEMIVTETSAANEVTGWVYRFAITDPAEIEELLPLIQYYNLRSGMGVFVDDFVSDAVILDNSGVEWEVWLRKGALPEKYMQRFLEEAQAQ